MKLSLPESDDFAVIATKTGYELCGGEMVYVRDKAVYDGDTILEENLITVRAYGYPDAAPDDPDLEYTGGFTYTATNAQRQSDGVFIADGGADVVVTITRGTQPKTWASVADSSWYDENAVKESYVLTTPEQLAGLISLVNNDGVTFAGSPSVLTATSPFPIRTVGVARASGEPSALRPSRLSRASLTAKGTRSGI